MTGDPTPPEPENRLKASFWRHLIGGYAIGLVAGAALLSLVVLSMSGMRLEMPWIYVLAAFAHTGTLGGLIGVGIYMAKVGGGPPRPPKGGKRAPAKRPVRAPAPAAAPAPALG